MGVVRWDLTIASETCSLMQSLNAAKPKTVQTPIEVRFGEIHDTGAEIETVGSLDSQDDEAGEAMQRRRARRVALLLVVLSGGFVIAIIGGTWLVLHG